MRVPPPGFDTTGDGQSIFGTFNIPFVINVSLLFISF
jgi:hypothetical protein